ncbi:hypothetical protein [Algibacter lectus]|uniref:hypothetical protein n=1 Tax=Algibacter lectus TaxID=221126 RepID=UPI0013281824|nr:hypothetical protein [Algibacter lectus]MWW26907.1 hypothetical protein [Algibacter lectus]
MRKTIIYLFILTFSFSFSQNKKGEILTDGQGNIIEKKELIKKDNLEPKTPNKILKEFYLNQNNFENLDNLMSFRFYQKTPYSEFKNAIESKNKTCGKLLNYKIVQTEYSDDKKSVRLNTDVNYENMNTIEQILLIKETDNDNYEVFGYELKIK